LHAGAVVGSSLLACAGALSHAARAGAAGAGAAVTGHASSTPCPGAGDAPDGRNSAVVDSATLCLMNRIRRTYRLRPLRRNAALATIATGQARDMVRGDYFGDQSLSGQSPLARIMASRYKLAVSHVRLLTAQNIGWGTGPHSTPTGIVNAWMHSPPHRAIILTGAYRDVGVGVAPAIPSQLGSSWAAGTYAVEFGARVR
jgi:uncharacterized protein YkwD